MHLKEELRFESLGSLNSLASNGDVLEVNTGEVGGGNEESLLVGLDTLEESVNIINTLSNRPGVLEGTSHGLGELGSKLEIFHGVLETGIESFSFSINVSTQSSSIKSISVSITRRDSGFSSGLSFLNLFVIHQFFLVRLGTPHNSKFGGVISFTRDFLGGRVLDFDFGKRVATLGAGTILLKFHTWGAGSTLLLTRLAHTGESSGLEDLDFLHWVSLLELLLGREFLFGRFFVSKSVDRVVLGSSVFSVSGKHSHLLGFSFLGLSFSILGVHLSERLGHFSPRDRRETFRARSDTFSLLVDGVDREELRRTASITLGSRLTLGATLLTGKTVLGPLVSEGTFGTDADGERVKSLGNFTGLVTGFNTLLLSVEPAFSTTSTAR
jgi:hypothetical protein